VNRASIVIVVLIAIAAAPLSAGEAPAGGGERVSEDVRRPERDDPADREAVERLIRRLGFPQRRERERAESDLVRLGPPILGLLEEAPAPLSAEARLRLARIVATLEAVVTERSIEPATLDLDVRDEPLAAVLDRIESRTGNRLPPVPPDRRERPVTLRAKRSTYWQAVDELLPQAGLSLGFAADGLRLEAGAPAAAPSGEAAGPLLVQVVAVRVAPTRTATPDAARRIRVEVRAAWEPRLEPLVARLPLESVQIDGPAGEALPPSSRRAVLEAVVRRDLGWVAFPVVVAVPDRVWPESLVVRGTLRLHLAGADHVFRLPIGSDDPGGNRRSVGAATVTVRSVRRTGDRLEAIVEAAYDTASEALASHRRSLLDRPLRLQLPPAAAGIDQSGRPSPEQSRTDENPPAQEPLEQEVIGRSDRGWVVRAVFEPIPPGVTASVPGDAVRSGRGRGTGAGTRMPGVTPAFLTWRLPLAIHEVPVDFLVSGVVVAGADSREGQDATRAEP
jgi:hypothetical protein